MSINHERRDFMRRALYCGLALGMPKLVLAGGETGFTDEGLIDRMARKLKAEEARMRELFEVCMRPPLKPEFILCGDDFYRKYGRALIEAGYEHEQVDGSVTYKGTPIVWDDEKEPDRVCLARARHG